MLNRFSSYCRRIEKTHLKVLFTGGRILLIVPVPGGYGRQGATQRVGDLGGTLAESFKIIRGEGQRYTGIEHVGCTSFHLQRFSCWTEGLLRGLSGVPNKGMSSNLLELDASIMPNEACMLNMLTSLAVLWANLFVKSSCSKICKTFRTQYHLARG